MGRELWNKLDIFLYIDEAARNQHTAATCSPGGFARYDIFVATEQGQFTRNSGIQKQNPVVAATRCSKNQNIKGKHGTKGKLTPDFKPPRSAFRADKDMRINEFYHLTRACSNLIPRPLDILCACPRKNFAGRGILLYDVWDVGNRNWGEVGARCGIWTVDGTQY